MSDQSERNRRRIHYVDVSLQRWLILGLSLVQVLAVVAVLIYLDTVLREILESQIYRVHLRPGEDVTAFAAALAKAFGLLLGISFLALLLADWLWSSQVQETLEEFRRLLERTRTLDLLPDGGPQPRHQLLQHFNDWRERERNLCAELRQRLDCLRDNREMSELELARQLGEARALLAARLERSTSHI